MKMPSLCVAVVAWHAVSMPVAVIAQSSAGPSLATMDASGLAERAARRFPQPVRVGDLVGRKVLGPSESQPLLGRIVTVVRDDVQRTSVVVQLSGWFATRAVAAPVEAFGLLGEHVALLDLTPDQLRSLPTFEATTATETPPTETIRVGLAKPFH